MDFTAPDNAALHIVGLTKRYRDFTLDHVSFCVPYGTVVGFIGENGAGKSTTLKAILGLIKKDAGTVSILGKREKDIDFAVRSKIGVVFDGNNLPEKLTPKQLDAFFSNIYLSWDRDRYFSLLEQLSLPGNKRIRALSRGMKMKLAIAAALSQNPDLLIMDEPTSGLDPVVRDDVLNMILDFVADRRHSVLLSSHITGDLEKIADTIVFLHQGKIIFCESKCALETRYGIIKSDRAQFAKTDPADIFCYRKHGDEWEALITDRAAVQKKYPDLQIVPATIDEIMLICVKGARP